MLLETFNFLRLRLMSTDYLKVFIHYYHTTKNRNRNREGTRLKTEDRRKVLDPKQEQDEWK